MYEIRASELGLKSDRLVFAGPSPVETVAQVVAYLEVKYGVRLPGAHMIFREGEAARWVLLPGDAEAPSVGQQEPATTIQAAVLQNLRRGITIHYGIASIPRSLCLPLAA